ncbi:tetratricopeptide repeat protein [Saccharopolyspora sp. K220]|uniref:tetratricopeptide repeat protein n=1 Tax=Saccharopolyspora soli TaxID=2926618 RepID=UPI001F5988EE|nr:tetratricopeptide repeat protein [Saccharopolyspora soli]MCI2422541.1 tetratricopeptide repeat protein [Saccharopolyspora soli]
MQPKWGQFAMPASNNGDVPGNLVQAENLNGGVYFFVNNTGIRQPGTASIAVPWGLAVQELRGREGILRELVPLLRNPGHMVVLHAAGGYGKTRLALESLRRSPSSALLWWVDATTRASLFGGLREVAIAAGARWKDVQRAWSGGRSAPEVLWTALANCRRRWILVLDNADDPDVFAVDGQPTPAGTGVLRAPGGRGTVLVISREGDARRWGSSARLIGLGRLSDADGAAMLLDAAPDAGPKADACSLATRLGGLPLALHLAGAYLAETNACQALPGMDAHARTFADYGRAWEQRLSQASDSRALGIPQRDREVLAQTWELSLDLLMRRDRRLARPLLRLLSYLAPAPIPHVLIDAEVLAESPLFPDDSKAMEIATDLRALRNVGLVELTEGSIVLHPVIRNATRGHIAADLAGHRDVCLALLRRATSGRGVLHPAQWPTWRALLPHCPQLHDEVDESDLTNQDGSLLSRFGLFCHEIGLLPSACALHSTALSIRKRLLGQHHPDTLEAWQDLTRVLLDKGCDADDHLEAAEAELRNIVEVAERELGSDHPQTLTARSSLAGVLHDLWHLDEAEATYRSVLAAFKRVLGAEHEMTLATRHNLALLHSDQDRSPQAEAELRGILAIEEGLFGSEHPRTLATRDSLALVRSDQGEKTAAEVEFRAVLEARKNVLGPEHPDTRHSEWRSKKLEIRAVSDHSWVPDEPATCGCFT